MKFTNLIKTLTSVCFMIIMLFVLSSCGDATTIYVYNWGDYIDPDVCNDFTEETGIKVKYDTFDSNEAMYTVLKNQEGAYDVVFPSDYMIERMINENMLEKLNLDNIPNMVNIDERFRSLDCDPNNEYVVTYMWGTFGIMYNTERVDKEEVETWGVLWDEQYANRIFMYDSIRDTLGLALRYLGHSLNTRNVDELNAASAILKQQLPLTQAYVTDIVKDKMIANEGDIGMCFSGDAMYAQSLNPSLDYYVPHEGSNAWYDGMVIPKGSKNKEAAEMFINFMSRPDIAARNTIEIGYTTTNKAALDYIDDEMKENHIFWPDDSVLERCETFVDLGDFISEYNRAWNDIFIGVE